ncbi:MAG: hypothetical protein JST54_08860 [Deltaproteobacteria bacterium]|nr:hypothetical protein [Deltaproteobacteria bacterium]
MRHFRIAALAAVFALAACGNPVNEGTTTTATSTTGNTNGHSTSTSTSTTGTNTSTTTSAGTTAGNASTTNAGTTGTSTNGTTAVTTGGTNVSTGSTGDTAGTIGGNNTGTTGTATASTTSAGTTAGTTTGATNTTGTSATSAGTTGSNCCTSDSDCVAQWGQGATCQNGNCYVTGQSNGSTVGGGCGFSTSTTGSTTGTTGTTCSTPCQTSADCPADPNATSITCEADGTCLYIDSFPSTGGSGGGGICPTTGGTTGSTTCTCSVDADCNDAYHMGNICVNGVCQMGPNGATASSTGGQCANQGSATSTTGTTGATTGGSGGLNCGCSSDADCNDPHWVGLTCQNGTCQFSGGAAASTTGTVCGQGTTTSSTSSTTGGGTSGTTTTSAGNGGGASTPLVLSFDSARVDFTQTSGQFELGQGDAKTTDWVSARTPWLALDRDGNGRIDSGEELFGSLTKLPDGRRAQNGFEALAALDANHDGKLDAQDPAFAKLVLWSDADQDRRSSRGELTSLAQAGVVAIELTYVNGAACDSRSNCEGQRAGFVFRGSDGKEHRGSVIDVYLAHRPVALSVR